MAGNAGVDALRADSMDLDTNVSGIGGGAGAGTEPDIFYQGVGAISRKVTAAGFYTDTGANRNMTLAGRGVWMAKVAIGNFSGATLLELRLGSGTNAHYVYQLFSGSGNYPLAGGGFLLVPIAHAAGYQTGSAGNPDFAACSYFAVYAEGPTSRAENLVLDAVDLVYGTYLTGGTVPSPASMQDILTFDEGTIGNRYGLLSSLEGILYTYGQVVIGATTASGTRTTTATIFKDSNRTMVFPDGRFENGFSGLTLDLDTAATDIDFTAYVFVGRGNTTTTDSRPTLEVFGTAGTAIFDSSSFENFSFFTLTSAASFIGTRINNSGQIEVAGANMAGSIVGNSTAASALLWNTAADPNGELDNMSFLSAGTGHAIELGANTPATITLTDHVYSGYAGVNGSTGNETIYNNSGKAITINYNGNAPTIRDGAGSSTTLVNSVSWTIRVVDEDGISLVGAEITVTDDSATPVELFHVESTATGTEIYSFDGADSGNNVVLLVFILGYEPFDIDTTLPASSSPITVPMELDRNENNPAGVPPTIFDYEVGTGVTVYGGRYP